MYTNQKDFQGPFQDQDNQLLAIKINPIPTIISILKTVNLIYLESLKIKNAF